MKSFVKVGTLQMDSGERLRIVSPSRMQRLAITSTMETIANYDAGTNQLILLLLTRATR